LPAVSNSSPLIVYARAERFELLRAVFEKLYVAPAVWAEVVERGRGRPGVDALSDAAWIRVRQLTTRETVDRLRGILDHGEAETIALATEFSERLPVLIDDGPGRRVAAAHGLDVVGSAGVLIQAKRYGLIPEVRPILEELREAGLYLGAPAVTRVLQAAGES
jgi:hypothetical protein